MALSITEQRNIVKQYSLNEHVKKGVTADVDTDEIASESVNVETFLQLQLTSIDNQFSVSFRNRTTAQQRLGMIKLIFSQLELQ